jgi:hypothetical protein
VGTGNGRDVVPEEVSVRMCGLGKFIGGNSTQVLYALGINMNFGVREQRKIFQLLDEASLGAVSAVQKR